MPPGTECMFHIGSIPIHGRLFLAPMAGISDLPYRTLVRRLGAGFSFTEFVSADSLSLRAPGALDLLRFLPEERPIIFQLYGADPQILLSAALVARELGPDIIDVNMGCSCSRVAHRGAGAGLLRDLGRAAAIVENLRKNLDIPVTAKIRLGWDANTRNYLETARALEEAGACMLSVHGRTKEQAYQGSAAWDPIGEIKARAGIPVLGNGDVTSVEEAENRMRDFGVDGVLIGRGAIGNPWMFSGQERSAVGPLQILRTVREHLAMMTEHYQDGVVLFRKHASRYLVGFPGAQDLRASAVRATDPVELHALIADFERQVLRGGSAEFGQRSAGTEVGHDEAA